MGHRYAEIAFTDTVKQLQAVRGSRDAYARREDSDHPTNHLLGPIEAAFITARDSFYMATVSETGWPYVQHRGGPKGFVKVLEPQTLGLADFSGNKQYISTGNLQNDDRISLFFMDYANRRRLKIFGRVKVIGGDDRRLDDLKPEGYRARIERGFLITIEALDWNCPQHITPRYTLDELEHAIAPLRERIAELEAECLMV